MKHQHIRSAFKSILLAGSLALGACSADDAEFVLPSQEDDLPTDITLEIQIPHFDLEEIGSRAVTNDQALTEFTVIGYDAANAQTSREVFSAADINIVNGSSSIRVNLPKGSTRVEVVANASALLPDPFTDLKVVKLSTDLGSLSALPMWGGAAISDLLKNDYKLALKQMTAKVTVTNAASSGVTLSSYKVIATAPWGYVAPTGADVLSDVTAAQCTRATAWSPDAKYVYETPAAAPALLLRATWNGKEYYYKVGFFKAGTNTRLDLRRNHHYSLTIKEINGPGAATEAEAISGDFSNRVVATLKESAAEIFDIIAANDVALGVCDDFTVAAAETSAAATILTLSSSDANLSALPTVKTTASWISGITVNPSYTAVSSGDFASPGRKYAVNITFTANNASSEPRSALFTVTFGSLSNTFTLTQLGTDFKRDPARKITLKISSATVTSDYFGWIDATDGTGLHGIKPQENSGVIRNEGLHFSTEADAANYEYLIPFITGDTFTSTANSHIKVTQSGSYWSVKLDNGSTAETTMWESYFVITNAAGVAIKYPVYRTGLFHNITTTVANKYQMQPQKRTGWFYYETVAFKGSDGSTIYYMLDRNIGASSNAPFSVADAPTGADAAPVGGYYAISLSKGDNVKGDICPAGLTVPSGNDAANFGFSRGTFDSAYGLVWNSVRSTESSRSRIARIFIPAGGYFEGEDFRNTTHANVWTASYLYGAQGFDKTSDEYKFWFPYYDGIREQQKISYIRYVNGAGAVAGSIIKGMPVRCIRPTAASPTGEHPAFDPSNVSIKTPITIYWRNTPAWSTPYCYAYNVSTGSFPGAAMTLVTGNVWKATVYQGDQLIFSSGSSSSQYPAASQPGWTATDGHIYGTGGDEGTYSADPGTVPVVTATPGTGTTFASSLSVTLSATPAVTIYYTLDGSTPSASSTVYTGPITLTATTTIQTYVTNSAGSKVQSFTYSKTDAPTPVTVYLEAPSSWGEPKAYAWNDDGDVSAAWPGDAMTLGSDGKYSWTVPTGKGTPTKIIFSNNDSNKTEDLVFVSGKTYTIEDSTPQYIYYYNGKGWSEVCAHFYNDSGYSTTWPGITMTAVSGHDGYYQVQIPDSRATKVIFNNNNNGSQSAEITFTAGKAYAHDNVSGYDRPW